MTSRGEFLSRIARERLSSVEAALPDLPPLRSERGAPLVERFVAAAEVSGAHVHVDVDPARIVAGRGPEEVGFSVGAYGLADSGSVVLVASADEPRVRSLLPPVHVTTLSVANILPGLRELFSELGSDLPSSVAIVTGPSRSADVEQELTIGVHGPGEVHVILSSE